MNLDENELIFVTESRELLEDMEEALLELERSPSDADLINRVFRAAHTIKGSAGLFGFDQIISFTHVVENVLDDVRNCLISVNPDLISLLMKSNDFIVTLIDGIGTEQTADAAEEKSLLELLSAFKAGSEVVAKPAGPVAINAEQAEAVKNSSNGVKSDTWHISLRLGVDTFREGFNPSVMFSQLKELGEIEHAQLVMPSIPALAQLDPESCYLGWEIVLRAETNKNTVAEIFEFISDAVVHILPPRSLIDDYQELIKNLPEDDAALGEILVEIGTLTNSELIQALNQQKDTGGFTGDILIEQGAVQTEVVEAALVKQKAVRTSNEQQSSFVRIDSNKLDELVSLVGELVISGAKVTQLSEKFGDEELNESMEEMTVTLEGMRETALGLRMVPIANTFNRFQRVIRDTSKELNKLIRLEIIGGETELDKTVIDKIGDPLMHLLRNSMDHGIETPAERVKAGKSEEGVITLKAYHETGTIVIEVSDDGAGLDAEKLLAIAVERGVVTAEQSLTEDEIYNLIFEAGFSTAQSVSNISGRGVGMDVVRRNVESLRGTVVVSSVLGEGVKMTVRLPLTLAIIDGFHIRVADESFIIPLDMVEECVTLNHEQKEELAIHGYIKLRNNVLPLIKMADYLGIKTLSKKSSRLNLVVVKFAGQKIGLLVDELQGEAQAVIKPLGRTFQGVTGFAGFTILGSGQLALIMDVPSLIKSAIGKEKSVQMNNQRPNSMNDAIESTMH